MRTAQVHGKPDVTQECWKAALDCLRAGVPTPQVAAALRPSNPSARARIAGRLKAAKGAIVLDADLSADDRLAELRRIRCTELELPIVQASDRIARKMSALLDELRSLQGRRQALAVDLRKTNQKLREVDRVGIGSAARSGDSCGHAA